MNRPFQMPRGWMDHPALACTREPFDRRSAYLFLIERANYGPGEVTFAGITLPLEQGQLAASITYLAKAWMWDACKVRRFLNRLHTDRVIDLDKSMGVTRITVCNYREIHDPRHTRKKVADTPLRHNRHQTEEYYINNVDETRRVDEGVQGEKAASGPHSHDALPFPDPDEQGQHGLLPQVEWFTANGYDRRTGNLPPGEPDELSLNLGRTSDELDELPPAAEPAPVELAAEPITSPAPCMDQPAASVAVALTAEPISTGPAAVGPPPAGVLIPPETMTRKRAARAAVLAEKGTRWPKGQAVPAEWIALAYADRKRLRLPEINLEAAAANFADYWPGRPGTAGLNLDWEATWRRWARTEKGQGNGRNHQAGNSRHGHSSTDSGQAARRAGIIDGMRRHGLASG